MACSFAAVWSALDTALQPSVLFSIPANAGGACVQIAAGRDADILLLDSQTMELRYVFAKGVLMRTPEWTRGGLFERGPRIRPRTL